MLVRDLCALLKNTYAGSYARVMRIIFGPDSRGPLKPYARRISPMQPYTSLMKLNSALCKPNTAWDSLEFPGIFQDFLGFIKIS